jgi:hypothetical protein
MTMILNKYLRATPARRDAGRYWVNHYSNPRSARRSHRTCPSAGDRGSSAIADRGADSEALNTPRCSALHPLWAA